MLSATISHGSLTGRTKADSMNRLFTEERTISRGVRQ